MRRFSLVVACLVVLLPSAARADTPELLAPRDAFERFAANVALFALSGATALGGFSRRPPLSLVVVAWPTTARQEDDGARDRVATWTVPACGRRPMFHATFVDLRF